MSPQAARLTAAPAGRRLGRNPGAPFDRDWVTAPRANTSALRRRAATLGTRRTVKGPWQVAWLLRAVTCLDLTTLAGDDTPGRVARLCAKARQPLRHAVLAAHGMDDLELRVGAVCVYPAMVPPAVRALEGSGIPVCSVATGFPAGQVPLSVKLAEIAWVVEAGAAEVDIVISRGLVLTGDWEALYDEVRAFKAACGPARMKAILGTGDLATLRQVAQASRVCLLAGADFIKTSTGKEPVNATLPVGLVMARAIRDYQARTGQGAGFKPAGGIQSAKDVLAWQILMREELGAPWLRPDRFRIGASSALADIERQLAYHATGRYAAGWQQPLA